MLNIATDILIASKNMNAGQHRHLSRRESHYEVTVAMDAKTITILSTIAIQVVKYLSHSDAELPPLTGFVK